MWSHFSSEATKENQIGPNPLLLSPFEVITGSAGTFKSSENLAVLSWAPCNLLSLVESATEVFDSFWWLVALIWWQCFLTSTLGTWESLSLESTGTGMTALSCMADFLADLFFLAASTRQFNGSHISAFSCHDSTLSTETLLGTICWLESGFEEFC